MKTNTRWKFDADEPDAYTSLTPYRRAVDGNLVAPYSVGDGPINRFEKERMEKIACENLCSACGKPLGDVACFTKSDDDIEQIRWSRQDGERVHHVEAPMHLQCARYALLACPHMREGRWSVLTTRSWDATARCEDDHMPEFWPDPKSDFEVLRYDEFLEHARKIANLGT